MRTVLGLLLAGILSAAGDPPADSAFRHVGPGAFALGKVTLDKNRRRVSFPASINQRDGVVEYAVVTLSGKTHESVFKTEVKPEQVQLALLLLGAKPANTNAFAEDPSVPLPGEEVRIEVGWQQDGREVRKPLENFIITTNNNQTLSLGPWIYNGSYLIDGRFLAEADGSIISVHTDPVALINNPRKGRENDDLHHVNSPALPPGNVPLEIRILLRAN